MDAVELARALCTDAELYGGHACLACQAAAQELLARTGGDLPLTEVTEVIQSPPHGLSHRTSRSHWARLLGELAGA